MRWMYNSMYNRMVPLRNDGRFDYSQPMYNQSGYDVRTPYHRNEVFLDPPRIPDPVFKPEPLDIKPIKVEPLRIEPLYKPLNTSTFLRKKCSCPIGFCTC